MSAPAASVVPILSREQIRERTVHNLAIEALQRAVDLRQIAEDVLDVDGDGDVRRLLTKLDCAVTDLTGSAILAGGLCETGDGR